MDKSKLNDQLKTPKEGRVNHVSEGEDIVITGMAGCFPDSNNIYHFRDNLYNKVDLVCDDYRRWKPIHPEVPQRTGKLFDVEKFDAGFFGVNHTRCDVMDPMLRLLHERCFETIVDAGYNPSELVGTKTGVFVGASFSEAEKSSFYEQDSTGEAITGVTRSMLAHNLSYYFKLTGPSMVTDTACSSSMFALDHAYRAIRDGLCDKAIVAGTALCLHPIISLQFARLGVLSMDGLCKTFDEDATGYARSEAICALLLERSRDSRRIYAHVLFSKTNCDGFKEQGITYPSSGMQTVLMKEFYRECEVDPTSLTFVEAHGTGTKVGDPEELNTIDEVFCTGRDRPLYIGAIKSNIGHNEPASGLCSIIKVLIGMENGFIPPNINFNKYRSGIAGFEKGRMKVVSEKMPWPDQNGLVGVNCFGFGGANAHVLLRWNEKIKIVGTPKDDLPRLVCVSGRTREAVLAILDDVQGRQLDSEYVKLLHLVFSKEIRGHLYRGCSIIKNNCEVERVMNLKTATNKKTCLTFNGFDKNWLKIGYSMMSVPLFAASIQKVQNILTKETKINLSDIITNPQQENVLNKILGTVAIQIGLADILKAIGLVPDFLVGVATGELVAAYFEGFLDLKCTVLASFYVGLALCKADNNIFNKEQMRNLKQLIPEQKTFFQKWLSPHANKNESYRQGSAEYFLQSAMTSLSVEKVIIDGALTILIGPDENNHTPDIIQLVRSDSTDPVLSLCQSLGSLYQHGYCMKLDEMYPQVQLPVSRGTPMISPLIKWDHTHDYDVALYKNANEIKGCYRVSLISVQLDDWNFVNGHVIDGRNLFPATGYLVLAWEMLGIMTGKLISDMKICFENVKFTRACNVPSKGVLKLVVVIQTGTKHFEVIEGDSVVVSGKIYEMDEQNPVVYLPETSSTDTDGAMLNQKDIYKELRLRGYNYKGLFRGLKSCSMKMSQGAIEWSGNWITFMDCMLQMEILNIDSRNLYVPTGIQKVVIDAPSHIKFASQNMDYKILPISYHKDARIIRSGAIEIMATSANSIPKRRGGEPVLEAYKFTPNDGIFPLNRSIRIMTQIILENTNLTKVKSVEIDDGRNLLSPLIIKTLGDIPLIQPEIIVLSNKALELDGITVEDKKLCTENNAILVVASNVFEEAKDFNELIGVVEDTKGYIIARERVDFDVSSIKRSEIEVLCVHTNEQETLILMQLHVEKKQYTIVEVSDDDLTWLEELQNATKINENIVVVSQRGFINGILGLVNCLRREPGGRKISCVFLTEDAPPFDPTAKFYAKQLRKNLGVNVWKDSKWGTYRHLLLDQVENVESEHCYVNVTVRGDLSSMRWIENSLSRNATMPPEKSLVHIYTSAINFRDVMTATGRIAADVITMDRIAQECVQGFEFSGRDVTGRRVMGMAISGALATIIIADSHMLWPIPDRWSMEDAATVPVVYGTVIYALLMRARMKSGQSILIHSGTGGVGQAAINIALYHGCTVFTTVGTQEKRDFIKRQFPQIKDSHIGNSRDTSFEQMIYEQTKGKGVDIILNSLAEEKLQASVRCLAPKGKFVEIGKFDLSSDNALAIRKFSKQVSFEGVMLDAFLLSGPDVKKELSCIMLEYVRNGAIKPLPKTVFKDNELEQAFRYMATGKHIGKVLISVRKEEKERLCVTPHQTFKGIPRFYCQPDESIVILGGLGGFGLELADWLIIRGAKNLVLTSRSGVTTGYQSLRLSVWKSYGANILIRKDDASTIEGCTEMIKAANSLAPVGAIFNLAVVLKDALFENQNVDDFKTVMLPKANVTKNLDMLSRKMCPKLKQFVIFSSVSCGRGNPGQTNYGMANSIMERICEQRKMDGYPALAIQWGAVGDVGLVAEMQEEHKELVIGGTIQQKIASCLQVLDTFLRQKETIVASMVVAEKRTSAAGANNIVDAVLGIIGINDMKTVSLHATFPELGMDSMMAVEIKQTLEREYEVFLTAQDIRTMSISKLQDLASEKMGCVQPSKTESASLISENLRLMLRQIGNEELSNIPVLRLKSMCESESTVYMLPGVEGLGVTMEPLAKQLFATVKCLQYGSENTSDTIESLAESIYLNMELTEGEFTIVAHSFGCMVATELVHLLERNGRRGKVVFIDGSCDLMVKLIKTHLQTESEAHFQTSILCALMHRYMPVEDILKHMSNILKQTSYEDRVQYVIKVSPKVQFSTKYITEMYRVGYLRLNAAIKYAPDYGKLQSKIKLFKPTQKTVQQIADDYELSKCFENVVSVETVDGHHQTILENPRVADEINQFIGKDHVSKISNGPRVNLSLVDEIKGM